MYHSINGPDFLPRNLVVSKLNFENQIKYLKKNYKIISYDEFKEGKKGVLLTFDDGFIDNYKFAYPILKKYNVPALFFILGKTDSVNWLHKLYSNSYENKKKTIKKFNEITKTNFTKISELVDYLKYKIEDKDTIVNKIGKTNLDNLYITKNQINQMSDLIEFGHHTKNHTVAKLTIESELKSSFDAFAYPFGEKKSYDTQTIKKLKKYYSYAFCTTEGFYSGKKYEVERISVTNSSILEFASIIEGSNFFINNLYKKLRFQK